MVSLNCCLYWRTSEYVNFFVLFGLILPLESCYVFPNEIRNPCDGVICQPGATCKPSSDGHTAECICPTSCPNYGDHVGSRPVCGSDAIDYPGECEMRKTACDTKTNITLKYYGNCDPCATKSCTEPELCQLDEQRKPICRCGDPCPLEFSPVCATDGKTYSNLCQMNREACRARKQLNILFRGQCNNGNNPCSGLSCSNGSECHVEYSIAKCVCATNCERVMRPVCGTDHNTYNNECELKRTACRSGNKVKMAYNGPCGSSAACSGRTCPYGGTCTIINGRPQCKCGSCSSEFAPVCGSDGISYGNKCQLMLEACTHRRNIEVLYDAPCNGCESKKCEHYSRCVSDGFSENRCVCPSECESGTDSEEVCGTDDHTYISVCELRNTSCEDKRPIEVKHVGRCESCKPVTCSDGAVCVRGVCSCGGEHECLRASFEPVCSSIGKQYPNECSLRRDACISKARSGPEITVGYYGECSRTETEEASHKLANNEIPAGEQIVRANACANIICSYEATCIVDSEGMPRCSCQFDCDGVEPEPVCASDLRIYNTLCHMKQEACRRQEELRLRPMELCRGLEVRPCGNDQPLVDAASGAPIDCGNGPKRKDCPAGSYCHQTARVARCCRKDKDSEQAVIWKHPNTPSHACGCNKLGSHRDGTCDANGQCHCRPGVGGLKCDRCEPGFWGLASRHRSGCIPCGCSAFGSVREDCEQMTGRCVCKPHIQGHKCTLCTDHRFSLGPNGCFDPDTSVIPPSQCSQLSCYFGAICTMRGGVAACSCPELRCPPSGDDNPTVCGNDGRTYVSACVLKREACSTQSDIVVQALGPCADEKLPQPAYLSNCTEPSPVFKIPLLYPESSISISALLPQKTLDLTLELLILCPYDGTIVSSYGKVDYITLNLRGFGTEIEWNLGSGLGTAKFDNINIGKAQISLKRYKQDALLKIQQENIVHTVSGRSPGYHQSLDLRNTMYVGRPPDHISRRGLIRASFTGCLQRLKIAGRTIIPARRRVGNGSSSHNATSRKYYVISSQNIDECDADHINAVKCDRY